jgi:hypothetical protein
MTAELEELIEARKLAGKHNIAKALRDVGIEIYVYEYPKNYTGQLLNK